MARNRKKRRSKLQKFLDFIVCFLCLTSKEKNGKSEEDNICEDDGDIEGNDSCNEDDKSSNEDGNAVDKNEDDDDNGNHDDDEDNEIVECDDGDSGDHDRKNNDNRNSVNNRSSQDDSDNRCEKNANDDDEVDTDEDNGIIVTRVYVSVTARNIVKHHDNYFARSESETNINEYVTKEFQKKPNKKSRNDSEWQVPSTKREIRVGRWLDLYSGIDIHEDAENDMGADGERMNGHGQGHHNNDGNGQIGNWDD